MKEPISSISLGRAVLPRRLCRAGVSPAGYAGVPPASFPVAQTSKSAVSQASKPAQEAPIWKSAARQVWKPAPRNVEIRARRILPPASPFGLVVLLITLLYLTPYAAAQCVTPSTNIASWWRAEQNTSDAIGGVNGTITNGVVYVTGKVGYAFLQTNVGAAVTLGNPSTLQLQNFTIEGWIQRYSTTLVSSDTNNGLLMGWGTGGYAIALHTDGTLFVTDVGFSEAGDGPSVTDTNWHHIAVTVSSGVVSNYVDGKGVLASSSYAPDYTFSTDAAVGARGDNQQCSFLGAIDELSIYTNALTSNQILAIYNAGANGKCVPATPGPPCASAPTNMVTWWRGESNALDSITGNAGTLTNGVTYTNGEVDYAFSQSATGAAVIVGNPSYIQLQNLTIEGWIKRYSTTYVSSDHIAGLIFGYGQGGYAIGLHTDGTLFWTDVAFSEVGDGPAVSDTNWHHIAVTVQSGVVSNYLDGNGVLASSSYAPGFTFTTNAAIGARGDDPYQCSFLGAIDELSIYNRALTSNEIRTIYLNNASGKCGPVITSPPANLAVSIGDNATFSVTATASSPMTLTYQWYKNGSAISGATSTSYTITGATTSSAGTYSVVISDLYAEVSASALLTVPNDLGLHVFIDQPLGTSEIP